jgi:exopolysaccharide biosynthesis polyprenyl glycosylphosphotransferase
MDGGKRSALRTLVLVLDAFVVAASIAFAFTLHAALRPMIPWLRDLPSGHVAFALGYIVLPLWLALASLFGLHQVYERPWSRVQLLVGLAKLHAVGLVALSVVLFLTQIVVNRSLIALYMGSSFVLMYATRAILHRVARWQHAQGVAQMRILVVGPPGPTVDAYIAHASAQPLGPRFVGTVEPDAAELERMLHDEPVDAVVFFPPYHSAANKAALLRACETVGVAAHFAIDLTQPETAVPRVVVLYDRPFVTFEIAPKNPVRLAIKHGFDVVAGLILLIVAAPVLAAASLAILATMGRPIFFVQDRAGLHGRRFRMIKLRTMVREAEAQKAALAARNEMTGPVFKVTGDPRVTRLGRFLRATSIDELPQLVNVVLGDMSLVGPRPLPVAEQQSMRGWHRRRLSMKPGLTCLWQVGGRNNVDFEQWMKLDLAYIDGWGLGLDLVILLKTLPAVLLRRGAK